MSSRAHPELVAQVERWPIAGEFRIARGSKTEAVVIVVELREAGLCGRSEVVPYARYGETVEGCVSDLERIGRERPIDRALVDALPAGSVRSALDVALWDLEAKRAGASVAELLGARWPERVRTSFTLSVGTPVQMATRAAALAHLPILKVKLDGDHDVDRIAAVRAAAPNAAILVDANESWSSAIYRRVVPELAALGVSLIEQPFPAGEDDILERLDHPIPVCADESCRVRADLPAVVGRYDAVNVKLDKAGGLSEAIALARAARERGLSVMVGCTVGTSLAVAPAFLLAATATWIDLDGPVLLACDRPGGVILSDGWLSPPERGLWGFPHGDRDRSSGCGSAD